MSNEHAKTALEVFEAALAYPATNGASWVEQACSDDASWRRKLSRCSPRMSEAGDFLDPDLTVVAHRLVPRQCMR